MSCPRVLIACTPKSGSTFVSRFLANYFQAPLVTLVPSYGCRHQEIEAALIPTSGPFVAQNHVSWSEHTERLSQEFGFRIVVLTRNLFDSIVSLREHFLNESTAGPLVSIDDSFANRNAFEQLELLIGMATPWYLNFFASYTRHEYDIHLYEELFSSDWDERLVALKKLVDSSGSDDYHSDELIVQSLKLVESEFNRRNIGLPGRGCIISLTQRTWIERLAKQLDSSIDYRRIGLFENPAAHFEDSKLTHLSPTERYELEYLRAKYKKVDAKLRELSQVVSEKQSFIDSQREYIDRFQQILERKVFSDAA